MFDEIKGKLAFGLMRLPQKGDDIDYDRVSDMVDYFLDQGFNYIDTARPYHSGMSEKAVKKCISDRHDRSEYLLADKLTSGFFKTEEDIAPLFEDQLATTGAGYFDFYLIHAVSAGNYPFYQKTKAFEQAAKFKEEGKIRHLGFSFHDSPELLEQILTEHPDVDFIQLQYNYLDLDAPNVQARKNLEVCRKHGKPVMVMEPVKGGTLANLIPAATESLEKVYEGTPASLALRFVASQPGIQVVLSGMSDMDQMKDNTSYMKDFQPLSEQEAALVEEIRDIYDNVEMVACTKCKYCYDGCPKHINIPEVFTALNGARIQDLSAKAWRWPAAIKDHGLPSECIKCGKCERICPQHLPIRSLLEEAAATFEN